MGFADDIMPFGWVDHETSFSLLLEAGEYKDEIFASRADEGFEGNGYDWESLARVFLNEKMPELDGIVKFDPEGSMFCAYSDDADALKKFAIGFKSACESDELIADLFSRAELD